MDVGDATSTTSMFRFRFRFGFDKQVSLELGVIKDWNSKNFFEKQPKKIKIQLSLFEILQKSLKMEDFYSRMMQKK